jgi:hypothetical protein
MLIGYIPISFAQNVTTTGPPPPRPITVTTNKMVYIANETIIVSGQINQVQPSENSVSIDIINPQGKKLLSISAPLSENGTYSYNLNASALQITGEHRITAKYGEYNSTALFMFIAHPYSLTIDGKSYPINYTIESGLLTSITANTQDKSLTLHAVNSTKTDKLTISLPREVIDSQNNDADTPFMVFVNGGQVQFNETTTCSNNSSRTLEISLPYEGQTNPVGTLDVKIIGTKVIPEFGSLAVVMISIIMAVIVTFGVISNKVRI